MQGDGCNLCWNIIALDFFQPAGIKDRKRWSSWKFWQAAKYYGSNITHRNSPWNSAKLLHEMFCFHTCKIKGLRLKSENSGSPARQHFKRTTENWLLSLAEIYILHIVSNKKNLTYVHPKMSQIFHMALKVCFHQLRVPLSLASLASLPSWPHFWLQHPTVWNQQTWIH